MKAVFVCLIIISCCSFAHAGPSDSYDRTTDIKKKAWMDKGMATVKSMLKDPNSAQFKNVYFNRGMKDIPVTCGEVNSKNSFGGYGGYQRFVSGGNPSLTFTEEMVKDFDKAWGIFCN